MTLRIEKKFCPACGARRKTWSHQGYHIHCPICGFKLLNMFFTKEQLETLEMERKKDAD